MKHIYFIAALLVATFSYGQGLEDFTNSNATSSYTDNNFAGNNGITWSYVASRDGNGDTNNSGINLPALMLRRASDGSKVTSSTISGGIGNFSVKLYKGFTGGGNRQVELFINGVSKGVSDVFDDYDGHTFTVDNINISGDITIEIANTTEKQVIIDDISWTANGGAPSPTLTVTSPDDNAVFTSGTTSVDVEFSTSNIDLGVAGNQVNITVNGTLFEDVTSPYNITTTDGETYNVMVDLLESGSAVDSKSLSFSVDEESTSTCPNVGDIIITEIMQNPAIVNDSDGEYFEVYNTTSTDIDMNGWTVADNGSDSFVISSPVVVPANGYAVFAINDDFNTNGQIPSVAYKYSGFALSNSDDEIILKCTNGTVIDQVFYDGGPNFPDPSGASMELSTTAYNSVDNDLGENWGDARTLFGAGDYGTPGSQNDFTLSNPELNSVQFSVYPNPTSTGFVNISSSNSENILVAVFDILGKQVINKTISNNRLNVSALNSGIYIMRISQNNATVTKKLVIK